METSFHGYENGRAAAGRDEGRRLRELCCLFLGTTTCACLFFAAGTEVPEWPGKMFAVVGACFAALSFGLGAGISARIRRFGAGGRD